MMPKGFWSQMILLRAKKICVFFAKMNKFCAIPRNGIAIKNKRWRFPYFRRRISAGLLSLSLLLRQTLTSPKSYFVQAFNLNSWFQCLHITGHKVTFINPTPVVRTFYLIVSDLELIFFLPKFCENLPLFPVFPPFFPYNFTFSK